MPSKQEKLRGSRFVLEQGDQHFPPSLACVHDPPQHLYGIGDPSVLREGIAIVGARKATPYGLANASYFARRAAARGVVVISGGARGCDAAAHRGALEVSGKTVVFLGGGCDCVYPAENLGLFQRIVDAGGAVVSEQTWTSAPLPWMFRMRNRLIAALARTILIVEAGLPSGTRDHRFPQLHRLSHALQYTGLKLRKLIKKQNAIMGKGNFTGTRRRAAPHKPCQGLAG